MSAPTLPRATVAGEGLTRDEWLEHRMDSIGGSEIAAVTQVEGS
ncbi:MAG: hypothetical protein JWO62_1108, partial [Acidimicrobiaceae bacterium]|nr:hypothetical protein [Acidimicrobiaceae bacterium]